LESAGVGLIMTSDLSGCKVLVTPTSYARHDPKLKEVLESAVGQVVYNPTGRPLTSAELCELLPGCDGYIAGLDVIDRAALQAGDRLRVIARYGVGVEKVDLEAARERGIRVTNTPGANSVSVAELTTGLMIALARQIPTAIARTRAGEWPRLSGVTLEGKTAGLLGLGSIGKQVARRLLAFDCHVIAYDPVPDEDFARRYGIQLLPQEEVVRRADFLSLHLPVVPETRAMVNAALLECMKPGSYLINTARGELIDEAALLAVLESGHLSGAALDCFGVEPPEAESPLLKLAQVLVTPHMGAHTDGATNAMGWQALRDCLAVLRGEPATYAVV
jgi:D-3-phosphoglycerate dehydrogenase